MARPLAPEHPPVPDPSFDVLLERLGTVAKQLAENHRYMSQWAATRKVMAKTAEDLQLQYRSEDLVEDKLSCPASVRLGMGGFGAPEIEEKPSFISERIEQQSHHLGRSWQTKYLDPPRPPSKQTCRPWSPQTQAAPLQFDMKLWPEWAGVCGAQVTTRVSTCSKRRSEEKTFPSWRSPYARWRMVWDSLLSLLITCDIFWIPFQAFDPPRPVGVLLFEAVSIAYWALDIAASFATGHFTADGTLVQDGKSIALGYLRRMFLIDLALVILDFSLIISDFQQASASGLESTSALRIGKAYRAVRIVRLLRMLRVVKLRGVQRNLNKWVSSESISISVSVGINMLILIIFIHVAACLWYLLGRSHSNDQNWVDHSGLSEESTITRYLVSLHWCLAQITPAPMNLQPQNTRERAFTVSLILLAILGYSTILSSITASMTRLKAIHYAKFQQWSLLERFLQQHKVCPTTQIRVTRFLEGAVARQKAIVQKEDVTLLRLLSEPLALELHKECFQPMVTLHRFFVDFVGEHPRSFGEVSMRAMQIQLFSKQDVLFEIGTFSPCMYFQNGGAALFQRPKGTRWDASKPPTDPVNKAAMRWVKEGQWFSEGALWVRWMHTGRMCAWTECEVLMVDSAKFRQIAVRTGAHAISMLRAKEFVAEQAALLRTHGCAWDIPSELCLCDFEPLNAVDGSLVDVVRALESAESFCIESTGIRSVGSAGLDSEDERLVRDERPRRIGGMNSTGLESVASGDEKPRRVGGHSSL